MYAVVFLPEYFYDEIAILLYTFSKSHTTALIKYKNVYLFNLLKSAFNKWISSTYKEIETKVISTYSGIKKIPDITTDKNDKIMYDV